MSHKSPSEGLSVLVCAPYGRDAENIVPLLQRQGYHAQACRTLDEVAARLDEDVGVVILTEEALLVDNARLQVVLAAQPAWSEVPFIVLAARQVGRSGAQDALRRRLWDFTTNAIVLERPLLLASLISVSASAMRARRKQFDMRDRLNELSAQTVELKARHDELEQSQADLRHSERRSAAIADSIDQMVWSTRPDGYHDYYNKRWYEFTGVQDGSTDGDGWNGMFHADDQERALARWRHSLTSGEPYHIEYRLRHYSGEYRWVLGRAQAMRGDEGDIVRWFGTCTDIHDLVEAREVLARSRSQLEKLVAERTAALELEMASRARAEATLRQSQKMEAIGQLTGGIAHDFNNMLTGVIGAMELMKRRIAVGRVEDLERFLDAALSSAQRAAALTARLLAFSRRQTLDPQPLDVNGLLQSLDDLLRRSIRENILLKFAPAQDLPFARADSNQLENAIINLVVNARDAMPDGGELNLETRAVDLDAADVATQPEIAAGRYVVISVSDTGVGMTPEIVEKAFDPFYTTKPLGQGTGLGLSMVYGFARQSDGQVRIRSQPGVGTTVSLYLPISVRAVKQSSDKVADVAPEGHGQTVLLVEDDPSVRILVREVLEELSYRAIEAEEGNAALEALRSSRKIDLMISDVGLPGINGRQLAEAARQLRPELSILFITGYAENAAIRAEFLGANMSMITKPFALDTLANKIAELMARPPNDRKKAK